MALAFTRFAPRAAQTTPKRSPPLLVLHGLFGSKQNWRSLGKALAERTDAEVFALDLPNHGESPWTREPMTYCSMSEAVGAFVAEHLGDEPRFDLLGHSMGAKVAMCMALGQPGHRAIRRLISVDMAPRRLQLSDSFVSYVRAMQELQTKGVRTKREADKLLSATVEDLAVRQFLLTNLVPKRELHPSALHLLPEAQRTLDDDALLFRLNLHTIAASMGNVHRFLEDLPARASSSSPPTYTEPSLFLYGSRARYVTPEMRPEIEQYFPRAEMRALDAGHWVHAEKPTEFVDVVGEFLTREMDD